MRCGSQLLLVDIIWRYESSDPCVLCVLLLLPFRLLPIATTQNHMQVKHTHTSLLSVAYYLLLLRLLLLLPESLLLPAHTLQLEILTAIA